MDIEQLYKKAVLNLIDRFHATVARARDVLSQPGNVHARTKSLI